MLEAEGLMPRVAQTDLGGHALLQEVIPGDWTIRCGSSLEKQALGVKVNELSEAWLQISEDVGFVTVLDEVGSPIVNATVRVSRLFRRYDVGVMQGRTNLLGKIGVRPLEADMYVEASADGYIPSSRRMISSKKPAVTLQMRRGGGSIRGTVRDEETGEPINGAVVTVGKPKSSQGEVYEGAMYPLASPRRVETDSEGNYSVENIGYDYQRINISAKGFGDWTKLVQVHPSGEGRHIVADALLGAELVLKGQIVTKGNEPVSGALVTLTSDTGMERKCVSLEDGTYEFKKLSPSVLRVHVRDYAGGGQAWSKFEFTSGMERDFVLSNSHTIFGRVVDEQGKPIHNAKVGLWMGEPGAQGSLSESRRTNSDGRFVAFLDHDVADTVPIAIVYPKESRFPCIVDNVELGSSEVSFVLDRDFLEPGRITANTARVLKVVQVGRAGTVVYMARGADSAIVSIEPVPPGEYEIYLWDSSGETTLVGKYRLHTGEQLDLGLLD
ncbi:MAG: carboxypeptidase-like regulatory domain-containing protein [Planctomycetota bacterium]